MRNAIGIVLVFGLLLTVFLVATRGSGWRERGDRDRSAPDAALPGREAPDTEKAEEVEHQAPVATITGTVVDEEGSPLSGLPLAAKEMKWMPPSLVNDWQWAGSIEEATTDEQGRFDLAVRPGRSFGVRSLDPAWIVKQPHLLQPGERDVSLVASPALSLTGTIIDFYTGASIPDGRVELTVTAENGNMKTVVASVERGRIGLSWRIDQRARVGWFKVRAKVSASGYRSSTTEVHLAPGEQQAVLEVKLEPTDLCVHLLELVDPRGHAVDIPLTVRVRPFKPRVRSEVAGAGRLRVFSTPGKHWLEIKPSDWASATLQWVGQVEFRTGREDLTRCEFPAFGMILFRLPEGETVTIGLDSEEESAVIEFAAGAERRFVCRPGEWTVSLVGGELQVISVAAGAEIIVDLTDR